MSFIEPLNVLEPGDDPLLDNRVLALLCGRGLYSKLG